MGSRLLRGIKYSTNGYLTGALGRSPFAGVNDCTKGCFTGAVGRSPSVGFDVLLPVIRCVCWGCRQLRGLMFCCRFFNGCDGVVAVCGVSD